MMLIGQSLSPNLSWNPGFAFTQGKEISMMEPCNRERWKRQAEKVLTQHPVPI
jgi:hypothetical protein